MRESQEAAAWLSIPPAVLHLFYASQGGIAPTPAAAWLLAFGTVFGSALVWVAARRGPWPLAWLGLAFLILPAILAWPAIGVSPGGQLALLLLLVAAVAIAVASVRGSKPPDATVRP